MPLPPAFAPVSHRPPDHSAPLAPAPVSATPTSPSSDAINPTDLRHAQGLANALVDSIGRVVTGATSAARLAVITLIADGHLLVEDVPGVGKTTLAKALARTIGCSIGRIQFTPDLLPSDLTGVSLFRAERGEFEFRPGPVFNNVVIGDEINRASPKTQSALLECMEEGQVTVDGTTHRLPRPFMVVATQNPIEMDGTYPLPEAQRDRFMVRVDVGYPDLAAEHQMLDRFESTSPLDGLRPVASAHDVGVMQTLTRRIFAAAPVKNYVLALVAATRNDPRVRLGASPRASLQLLAAAKARALLDGRDYCIPDDVQALYAPVVAHRLILNTEARLQGVTAGDVVGQILATTPVPR